MPTIINFVSGFPDQTLNAVLDTTPVTMRAKWNERFGFWSLSIYDRERETILAGVKLVQNFPLTSQYSLDEFTGELFFLRMSGTKDRPDFDSLGGDHVLAYFTKDEINAL